MVVNTRKMKRVGKAKDFGIAYQSRFSEGSVGRQRFELVATAVAALSDMAGAWNSTAAAMREARERRLRSRTTLRETLATIKRTAKAAALYEPGFDVKLSPEPALSDAQLLASARGVLEYAPSATTTLTALGLPADFLSGFAAKIRDLDQAMTEQSGHRTTLDILSGRIRTELENAHRAVTSLDAIVRNTLASDDEAIAAWNRAWRIPRAHRKLDAAPVPTPAPEPSVQQAA